MIPPIPISAGTFHYTLDALRYRSDDLTRASTLIAEVAMSLTSDSALPGNHHRLVLQAEYHRLASDIADVRLDIDGVIATIEPSESARATLATGGPWASVRTVTEWMSRNSPWMPAVAHAVPVDMTRTETNVDPPADLHDRFERVPRGDSPVRIDRFETPAGPRFEVYIAGTVFAAGPRNPWWAGANASLLSTGQSDSLATVESALRDAGVTSTTPIVITGHSQGGVIGLALANSNRYTVDALFTVGTPVGIVEDVPNVPQVHIAHPEDPVPALGGTVRSTTGTTWLAHTEPRVVGAAAHVMDSYRHTVADVDAVGDPTVQRVAAEMQTAEPGTARWFRAVSSG